MRPPLPVLLAGLATFLVAAWLVTAPLQGIAHTPDEIAYLLQARILAGGHRYLNMPDPPGYWRYSLLLETPGLSAAFPLGWPLLLAVGTLLGAPMMVNPLLGALVGPLCWLFARRLGAGERAAALSAVAIALSPGLLALAASQMSHTSVLVATLIVGVQAANRRLGWATGVALAYIVLARPLDAVFGAAPLMLLAGRPDRRTLLRVGLPLLFAVSLMTSDNTLMAGAPWRHPASVWFDAVYPERAGCNSLGFGMDKGCFPTLGTLGHTPAKALEFTANLLSTFDRLLLGVPGGGLLALAGLALLARKRKALLVPPLALLTLHALYWNSSLAYGARFLHPLMALAAVGLALAFDRLPRALGAGLALLPLLSLPRLSQELGDRYWCVDASLRDGLAARHITQGNLFVDGQGSRTMRWPFLGVPAFGCNAPTDVGAGFILFDPSRQAPLRVRNLVEPGQTVQRWLEHHGDNQPAWAAIEDIPSGVWTLAPIDPSTGLLGKADPL